MITEKPRFLRSTENTGDALDPLGNAEQIPLIMRSMMSGSIHASHHQQDLGATAHTLN